MACTDDFSSVGRGFTFKRRTCGAAATLLLAAAVSAASIASQPGTTSAAVPSKPPAAKTKPSGPKDDAQPAKTKSAASTRPTTLSARDQQAVADMEKYYANLYAKPLEVETNARLAHLIAVTSLARIEAGPTTDKLIFVAKRGKADAVVSQVAWEALAVRYASLSAEQRSAWLDAGLATAEAGGFPGETAGPLLAALATRPLPKDPRAITTLLLRVAEESDPATAGGRHALNAAGRAVARWSDREQVAKLVGQMKKSAEWGRRIDVVLRHLPDPPAKPEAGEKSATLSTQWGKWLATNSKSLEGRPAPATRPAYAGESGFFPAAERILDPRDPKWSGELELPPLKLSDVSIAFCVDATGSMAVSNEYVTAYLEMAVRAMSAISPSVRAGAVYYRHEAMPAFQVECCKKAVNGAGNFLVRTLPLTKDIPGLVQLMEQQKVGRNAGHTGGAYLTAVTTAAELLGPAKKDAARVAIVVGDTFATPGTEKVLVEATKKAADAGMIVVFVERDAAAARAVSAASHAAIGQEAILYTQDLLKFKEPGVDPADGFVTTAFGKAAQRAIAAMTPKPYADRVPVIFKNVWRIFLAEKRAEKAKAALR